MYDITALGEILIDFTYQGIGRNGQKLFAQNPGGAPANALTSAYLLICEKARGRYADHRERTGYGNSWEHEDIPCWFSVFDVGTGTQHYVCSNKGSQVSRRSHLL